MGLDDVIDNDDSSPSSSSRTRDNSSSEDLITIGSPPNEKKFSEEKWEEVKKVIQEEMQYSVNEVKHLPSGERYEVLHEAATWDEEELTKKQEELRSVTNCIVCGINCSKSGVELEGHMVCVSHPAAKVAKALENK